MIARFRLPLLLAVFVPTIVSAAPPANPNSISDPVLLAGMRARAIGPAAMSGRVPAVEGVASDPRILYVGGASGGVWKSEDQGLTWRPIFDDQPVHSIGAIAVNQANPDIVWVGSGEGNPRNSASVGNGIYRSLDGGRTWQHLGLEATERIYRVVLDPRDPQVAYVAALGREWGENPERGVYKTTDGGHTWKRILYVDARTGASELVMDPSNPNKLIASMWDYRRWPWFFRSGGPGSGLYVTYDGGESWKHQSEDDGLPKGQLGRIGVAFSDSDPRVVYAIVESEGKNAVLRSEDGGQSWKTTTTDPQVTERPFYYADIRVDPTLPNRIYDLTSRLRVSNDSGKTWEVLGRSNDIHGDYQAMWINPRDPQFIIVGEDGGVGISRDRGQTWQFMENLPFGQYYHVTVDMDMPYHVYGGLQDNGSWRGPSSVWEPRGIRNGEWDVIGGGDGFMTFSDPSDSMIGYSESQGGSSVRWNLHTGERRFIQPPDPSIDPAKRLRFNWNAGLAQDPFDAGTIYSGSQYLHRSTDRGDTWTTISPDLTTNNPEWQKQDTTGGLTLDVSAAENYTTILTIAPSSLEKGMIWVGTDDGRVQLTRDGGAHWTSLEGNIPGVPANTWVPQIRASRIAAGTAFVVFDDHRRSNWTPYVYRTDDYGKTWKSVVTSEINGYALAIEQDGVDKDLLFVGTEFGLYVSWNNGAHWTKWTGGLPAAASVMDVIQHPRDQDLVLATHGRSLFVIDDVAPLRQVNAATLNEPLHLYDISPALEHFQHQASGPNGPGSGEFYGENRPFGALITYSLNLPNLPVNDERRERERKEKERAAAATRPADSAGRPQGARREDAANTLPAGAPAPAAEPEEERPGGPSGPREAEVDIRITDSTGKTVRTFHGPAHLGINRAVWDLGRDAFKRPPRGERGGGFGRDSGPEVLPGTYGVVVKFKDHEAKGTIQVQPNPVVRATDADLQAREAAIQRTGALQVALVEAIERINAAKADVDLAITKLRRAQTAAEDRRKESGSAAPSKEPLPQAKLIRAGRELQRKLNDVESHITVSPEAKGLLPDHTAFARVQQASQRVQGAIQRPNAGAELELRLAEEMVQNALAETNKILGTEVVEFQKKLADAKIELLATEPPVEVKSKQP